MFCSGYSCSWRVQECYGSGDSRHWLGSVSHKLHSLWIRRWRHLRHRKWPRGQRQQRQQQPLWATSMQSVRSQRHRFPLRSQHMWGMQGIPRVNDVIRFYFLCWQRIGLEGTSSSSLTGFCTLFVTHGNMYLISMQLIKNSVDFLSVCLTWYFQGFFRRSLIRKDAYICRKSTKCELLPGKRNMCAYCRLQKCIEAGMSVEGSSFCKINTTSTSSTSFQHQYYYKWVSDARV